MRALLGFMLPLVAATGPVAAQEHESVVILHPTTDAP